MGIQLYYTDIQGVEHTSKYDSGVATIDLSSHKISSINLSPLSLLTDLRILDLHLNKIKYIDLSSLSSCTKLQKLNLAANQLETINLSPIKSCSQLQYLGLWHNKFQKIDLSPLSGCQFLEKIHLHENQLENIDLSPLESGNNLKELSLAENKLVEIDLGSLVTQTNLVKMFLYNNRLESIDLSPLRSCIDLELVTLRGNKLRCVDLTPFISCTKLRYLYLKDNQFESVDVTPLIGNSTIDIEKQATSWLRRSDTIYRRPTTRYQWEFLYEVALLYGSDLRVQHDILYALGFQSFGFIDCDLRDILISTPPETPTEEARTHIARLLVKEITKVVDRGGATTGLMLEELITKYSEIAKRTQKIVDLRENELRRVVIGVKGNKMDMRELWITAYGYNILKALNMSSIANSIEFRKVLKAFDEIGYVLRTGNITRSRINMSNELKETILWFVESKNMNWRDIVE